MLAFISFLLVVIGCANWFCIGILQFDFVAGIFGSQSNIFSRLIYTLVGIASIIMVVNFIMNKGKFVVSFKKAGKEFEEYKEEKEEKKMEKRRKAAATESSNDFAEKLDSNYKNDDYTEASSDMGKMDKYENYDTLDPHDNISDDCNCKKNCECSEENNCGCKNPTGSNRAGNKRT